MTEKTKAHRADLIGLTSDIVAAYLATNSVPTVEVPALIASVHTAISGLASGQVSAQVAPPIEMPTPAQVRKSVTHDALISFIDGRSYKTLKRHLSSHGFTPNTYRVRYGLPKDYPMVAPSYSEQRSNLAKAIGLGVPGTRAEHAQEPDEFDQAAPKSRRKAA